MTSTQNYSWVDRMFHRVAFSSPSVQLTAADVEKALYGRRFTGIRTDKPIFVTSMPRAGTTLMLEILGRLPTLATYCYRDMPFVLAPLLWDTLSKHVRKPAHLEERAHGDGMRIGYDSPEAFEEVLWRTFWPHKFGRDGIALWADDEEASEFRALFVSQIQRIIAARSNGTAGERRYLSKNNANIARLGLLRRLFPDAVLVVPFRDPADQARSLLRQHTRFLGVHREDPFARRYMEDVGHLEFGALHRPIRFQGTSAMLERYRADTIDYWIAYWVLAFEHILRYRDDVVFVSYRKLCKTGVDGIRTIAAHVGVPIEDAQGFEDVELREPRSYGDEIRPGDGELLEMAHSVYEQLSLLSVV